MPRVLGSPGLAIIQNLLCVTRIAGFLHQLAHPLFQFGPEFRVLRLVDPVVQLIWILLVVVKQPRSVCTKASYPLNRIFSGMSVQ